MDSLTYPRYIAPPQFVTSPPPTPVFLRYIAPPFGRYIAPPLNRYGYTFKFSYKYLPVIGGQNLWKNRPTARTEPPQRPTGAPALRSLRSLRPAASRRPIKWLACGQASTRRGTPRRCQLHHLRPYPAPRPLKGRQKRFSREKQAGRPPALNSNTCAGWKAARLNAKRKASSQAAELASIAISDEAGPGITARPRRNAQEARNRARVGVGATDPGKRLYGQHRPEFRP